MLQKRRLIELLDVSAEDAARISRRVVIDSVKGCWLWQGATVRGYGAISCRPRGSWMLVHRAVFIYCRGRISDDACVLHACDVRNCVNPGHLFLGTYKDNNFDRMRKGRNASKIGILNGRAKLSSEQIASIINDFKLGLSGAKIASKYGISKTQAFRIQRGESWAHTQKEST